VLRHSLSVVFVAAVLCLVLVLVLFPDGRVTPRWSRWLPLAAVALFVAIPDAGRLLMGLLDGDTPATGRARVLVAGWSAVILLGLFTQVRRYRHVSGPVERQQAKWVVFPLGALLALFVVILALPVVTPGPVGPWFGVVLSPVVPLGILLPLSVANAVLRYRLYDIDDVISRTVSYTLLMAVLAGVYTGAVVGLGAAVRALTGETGGDLVVAASTLAVAALFQPLRRHVQALVGRRFNRARYDAQRTIEIFAHRLRDEVDLSTLVDDLCATATAALRPHRLSVWLPAREGQGGDAPWEPR
jgi:hypothetical protein